MINFKKKEMIPLTNKKIKSYEKQKVCYICEKKFCHDKNKYDKVIDHCHYTRKFRKANICNLKYNIPNKFAIVFHNHSIHDYHFVIKKLAEDFKGEFECLGENTEKHITFSVPLKKENDNGKKSHIN